MIEKLRKEKKWQTVSLLRSHMAAENVMSLIFDAPGWAEHKAGQHLDIRLTASNGYQAQRDYSLANPPEEVGKVELGVQLLPDGEVSPYLFKMKPGEQIEISGPGGRHFVWDISMPGPLVLIGGGSGMVPLMAMVRHHMAHFEEDKGREIIFLVSARTEGRVLYKEELKEIASKDPNFKLVETLSDIQPKGWSGYTRRIDKEILEEVLGNLKGKMPMIYVCGPTPFVEAVANNLVAIGFNSHEIRTERFGGA